MFGIQTQLFEAQDVRFGPIDFETHPAIESRWTHDAEFMRLMELKPVRPLSPAMVARKAGPGTSRVSRRTATVDVGIFLLFGIAYRDDDL